MKAVRPGPGGSAEYEVGSCQEAIELARTFREKGAYDWFRGQASAAHPVVPTLLRATTDLRLAEERLDRFFGWARRTRGLEPIARDETQMHAVAQHYGMPTHFVDFTVDPDVAGFFAWDTKEAPPPAQYR
jgi:hypothetical protein